MAGGTVAGSGGRSLRAATGATGDDPEEAAGEVPSAGHSMHPGPGGADVGHARAWPIFEAGLQPEQYACRPGRSAGDAAERVRGLLNRGRREVVGADLSSYFGEIPRDDPVRSLARRAGDGRMLALAEAWLETPAEEDDGKGGARRATQARKERKGTPRGAPISPLPGNIYMRRFILGWRKPGYSRRFRAEIASCADDFCVLGKAPAEEMLAAVARIMEVLKLPADMRKTRCLRRPEEPIALLGCRIGWSHRRNGKGSYIGTRPDKAGVRSICRRTGAQTAPRFGLTDEERMAGRINRTMSGWANYFRLGQVGPACRAVDEHAARRLRQWLCRKHKVIGGKYVRFSHERLWNDYGPARLAPTTKGLPRAKA